MFWGGESQAMIRHTWISFACRVRLAGDAFHHTQRHWIPAAMGKSPDGNAELFPRALPQLHSFCVRIQIGCRAIQVLTIPKNHS